MLPIKNNGKYFVKDTELLPTQKDEFGHEDIAKNIINIVENEKSPFNIAIVGKWGLGKSSLIKIVTAYFSTQNNYVVEEINAWKYEKEALRRVFLRKILFKLGYKDDSALNKFLDKLNTFQGSAEKESSNFMDYIKEWGTLLGVAITIYIIGILCYSFVSFILNCINVVEFSMNNWRSFVLDIFIKNFYMPIFLVLIQKYIKATKSKYSLKLAIPAKTTDEYEDELKKMLEKSENTKKTIITVVDDLDRLTPEKIVEALDAIKAFVNYDNCIFLVPFDDTILKKALKNKTIKLNNNEHLFIESELFLDKLFQYKIFLPNVIVSDLPQYALMLVQQEAPDLYKFFKIGQFERICKEILIHKGVTTPRQVKKIINAFANNVLLAYRREYREVPNGTFTSEEGFRMLAKISVLQADFSGFYSNIFVNPDLISEFIKCANNETPNTMPNELLRLYFDIENNKSSLSKSAENLYNFLSRTSNITCIDISQYLYMAQDSDSIMFGSELSRSLRNSMTSGSEEIVRKHLEENKNKDLTKLLYNILMHADLFEYGKCSEIVINLYDYYKQFDCNNLINLVGERITAVFNMGEEFNLEKIKFNNLYEFYIRSVNKDGLGQAIVGALNKEDTKQFEKLSFFFENSEKFDVMASNVVKNLIFNRVGIDSKLMLNELCSIESIDLQRHYIQYFSDVNFFNRLAQYITDEEPPEDSPTIRMCLDLFDIYIVDGKINDILNVSSSSFSSEYFFNLFYDKLLNSVANIGLNVGSKLCAELIKISDKALCSKVNLLLSKMNWKIDNESQAQIDDYLLNNITDEHINTILKNIALHKCNKYIPKSIEKINTSIIGNSIDYDTIEELQKEYIETQRDTLFTTIQNKISYNHSPSDDTYEIVSKLLKRFINHKENNNLINRILTQIFSQIQSYPNDQYTIKALSLLQVALPIINESNCSQFILWASNASYMGSHPVATMTILDILKESIPQKDYLSIATNIMNYTNADVLSWSLRILQKIRTAFKDGGAELTAYKEFLLKYIDVDSSRREIIRDIDANFGTIGNVDDYVVKIIAYEDIHQDVVNTSVKFLNATEDVNSKIKNIIDKINVKDCETADEIFKIVKNDSYNEYLNNFVGSISQETSIISLVNLLKLLILNSSDFNDKIMVVAELLLKQVDSSGVSEVLDIISMIPEIVDKTKKRIMGDILYDVFRKTSNVADKKIIYNFVVKYKLEYTFKKDEKREKRDFTDEEKEIVG
jgi:hypothetical protein